MKSAVKIAELQWVAVSARNCSAMLQHGFVRAVLGGALLLHTLHSLLFQLSLYFINLLRQKMIIFLLHVFETNAIKSE